MSAAAKLLRSMQQTKLNAALRGRYCNCTAPSKLLPDGGNPYLPGHSCGGKLSVGNVFTGTEGADWTTKRPQVRCGYCWVVAPHTVPVVTLACAKRRSEPCPFFCPHVVVDHSICGRIFPRERRLTCDRPTLWNITRAPLQ
jgi:hypothetical protein